MNALVSIDRILEPTAPLNPATLFGSGQIETIVHAIETDVRSELYDISTEEGRERIKSVAYKIARSKTTLDEIGKDHVAEIKAQSAAIDKERKTLRDRLDALKDEIRKPVTDWEEAEAKRIEDHEAAIVAILQGPTDAAGGTSLLIGTILGAIEKIAVRDWQEFEHRGIGAFQESRNKLAAMLATAEQRERDAAELEQLRAELAARKAKEAEETARAQEAERKAEREKAAVEAAKRAEEEKAAAVARAIELERARAEQEKLAAIEAERRRQEQEQARALEEERRNAREEASRRAAEIEAEQKRQANKRHRAKVQKVVCEALSAIIGEYSDAAGPAAVQAAEAIIEAIETGRIPLSIQY